MLSKAKIKELMRTNGIANEGEARQALDFIRDLMDAEADHIEETEPYAINTINRLRTASTDMCDLLDELDN